MRLPSMLRSCDRELVCARCGSVMAFVHIAAWNLRPVTVRRVDGADLAPATAATMLRVLEVRIAGETDEFELIRLHEQVEYVRRQAGELIFELTCPCGAHYLRSLPRLAKQARTAAESRVVIG